MQLYAKPNQYYALYLDISCLISSPVETICRKNQSFIYLKNMKNVSLCFPVFLGTRHRPKLRREVTPPMKNIEETLIKLLFQKKKKKKKKNRPSLAMLIKLLFQKKKKKTKTNRPNLAILSVYILLNSVYV